MPFLAFGMPAAPEWIFIAILALVLLGPKKLPELARGIAKALGELQKAKEDFHREISGVPPLPKIQPPQGLQGLQENQGVQSATSESAPVSLPPPESVVNESTPATLPVSEEKKG